MQYSLLGNAFLVRINCYLKDSNPSIKDIVKVDGSLERVDRAVGAVGIVLVPVDARGVIRYVGVHVKVALHASFIKEFWHGVAVPHAVVFGLRADEGVLVIVFSVVVFISQRALEKKKVSQLDKQIFATLHTLITVATLTTIFYETMLFITSVLLVKL